MTPDLTTRAGQLHHVVQAMRLTLEVLDVSMVHLPEGERRDALARGFVCAFVQRYRGAELAAVVARLRTAADWLEAKGAELAPRAPAPPSPHASSEVATDDEPRPNSPEDVGFARRTA